RHRASRLSVVQRLDAVAQGAQPGFHGGETVADVHSPVVGVDERHRCLQVVTEDFGAVRVEGHRPVGLVERATGLQVDRQRLNVTVRVVARVDVLEVDRKGDLLRGDIVETIEGRGVLVQFHQSLGNAVVLIAIQAVQPEVQLVAIDLALPVRIGKQLDAVAVIRPDGDTPIGFSDRPVGRRSLHVRVLGVRQAIVQGQRYRLTFNSRHVMTQTKERELITHVSGDRQLDDIAVAVFHHPLQGDRIDVEVDRELDDLRIAGTEERAFQADAGDVTQVGFRATSQRGIFHQQLAFGNRRSVRRVGHVTDHFTIDQRDAGEGTGRALDGGVGTVRGGYQLQGDVFTQQVTRLVVVGRDHLTGLADVHTLEQLEVGDLGAVQVQSTVDLQRVGDLTGIHVHSPRFGLVTRSYAEQQLALVHVGVGPGGFPQCKLRQTGSVVHRLDAIPAGLPVAYRVVDIRDVDTGPVRTGVDLPNGKFPVPSVRVDNISARS